MNLQWLKSIDVFGKKVELQVDGGDSYKSYVGATLSLFYGIIMAILSVITIKSYLSTSSPILFGESYQRSLYPEIHLEQNKLMPFLIVYSTETDLVLPSQMDKYFSFSVEKIVWKTVTDDSGATTVKKIVSYNQAVPCGSLSATELQPYDYVEPTSYLKEMIKDYAICLPGSSDLRVFGKGSDEEFGLITFKIKPCSLQTGCASLEELGKVNFQWVLPQSTFDSTNYKTPKKSQSNADDIYYLNPAIRQMYSAKFKENVVWDSIGLFQPDLRERTRYFDLSSTFVTQAFRDINKLTCSPNEVMDEETDCHSYFEFSFLSSGSVFNYIRSYKTLVDTLADIGGLNGIVILAFLIFAKPFGDWNYKRYLLTKLQSFLEYEKKKEQLVQKKKMVDGKGVLKKKPNEEAKEKNEAKGNFWCCLNKTPEDEKVEELKNHAQKSVEMSLDIVSIIRDINTIKALAGIFFKERHINLAEIVQFKKDKQRLDKKRLSVSGKRKSFIARLMVNDFENELTPLEESIEDLKNSYTVDSPGEASSNLRNKIVDISDEYYREVLFKDEIKDDPIHNVHMINDGSADHINQDPREKSNEKMIEMEVFPDQILKPRQGSKSKVIAKNSKGKMKVEEIDGRELQDQNLINRVIPKPNRGPKLFHRR